MPVSGGSEGLIGGANYDGLQGGGKSAVPWAIAPFRKDQASTTKKVTIHSLALAAFSLPIFADPSFATQWLTTTGWHSRSSAASGWVLIQNPLFPYHPGQPKTHRDCADFT